MIYDTVIIAVAESASLKVLLITDVSRGMWYYEVNIDEMRDGSACRIGWGQAFANLQTPLGFDKFGYCWRSR